MHFCLVSYGHTDPEVLPKQEKTSLTLSGKDLSSVIHVIKALITDYVSGQIASVH